MNKSFKMLIIGMILFSGTTLAQTISGTVFRDFNTNGSLDRNATFYEPGVIDVTVTAYFDDGTTAGTATTAFDGTYTISGITAPVRVEFTNFPNALYAGMVNAADPTVSANPISSSTIAFAEPGDTNVSLSLWNPNDYCQTSPYLVTPCYVFGDQVSDLNNTLDVLVGANYDWGGNTNLGGVPLMQVPEPPKHYAAANQMGTTYGVAWDKQRNKIYASAFFKQFAGFGPNGPGAIYQVSVDPLTGEATGTPSLLIDLKGQAGINVCDDLHSTDITTSVQYQDSIIEQIGKCSLGDLEISDDGNKLYVMNLTDRQLVEIDISGASASVSNNWSFPLDQTATCANPTADTRPFALGYKDGQVWVGAVCSEQSNDTWSFGYPNFMYPNSTDPGDPIYGYIYMMDPTTGTFAFVKDFDIRKARYTYSPWSSGFYDYKYAPAPILADIEFYGNDLTIALRDRWGDIWGDQVPSPDGGLTTYTIKGDIICLSQNADGSYTVQSESTCGRRMSDPNYSSTGTAVKEYYYGDGGNFSPESDPDGHNENANGGLAQFGDQYLAYNGINSATAVGVHITNAGGFALINQETGGATRAYTIYSGTANDGVYGKANGLGDVEPLCLPAPVEIGNRVWLDSNNNNIQDGGEPGISGVLVTLKDGGGATISTATTDARGNYIFSSAMGTNSGSHIYGLNLSPNTNYTVSFPTTATVASTTYNLVTADSGSNNLIDSDATAAGDVAVLATDIPLNGANNHSFDVGYATAPVCMITATSTTTTCSNAGTPSDPSDDTYTFSVTVTDEGGASSSWTANDPLSTMGGYGSATSFGPYTISGNGSLNITLTDSATGSCQFMLPTIMAPSTCSTVINTSADLRIEKVANTTSIQSGQQFTYTITVTNDGPDTAVGVSVTDLLPSEVTYMSHSSTTGHTNYVSGTGLWTIGDLANGANAVLTITVMAN